MDFYDLVKDTTTTTGTGNLTLAGAAPTGFRTFGSTVPLNDPFGYAIRGSTEWEVGFGYLSGATTLVRTAVVSSSNSDALVNFSAGTKDVSLVANAQFFRRASRGANIVTFLNHGGL